MAVVRWTFEDPVALATFTFPMNPNEGGSQNFKKNVQQQATCAPDGGVVLFEGRDVPATFEFSGTLLTQEHYEALQEWWDKRRQIKVTDDLGRETWIYIVEFDPKRVRSALYPWKHTFTVRAVVVEAA